MSTIELRKDVFADGTTLTAKTRSLAGAMAFVRAYSNDAIAEPWNQREGRWVAHVYDWLELWFDGAKPFARITAPVGFVPDDQVQWRWVQ